MCVVRRDKSSITLVFFIVYEVWVECGPVEGRWFVSTFVCSCNRPFLTSSHLEVLGRMNEDRWF